ncbi:MAG TPA: efflux RND transporter periplasmic adaptor subunit [Bryobacteraceae bacterium]|jgi:cobalt-zinc-cadmium efflux system membrane fusion protein
MNRKTLFVLARPQTKLALALAACLSAGLLSTGCGKKVEEVSANTGPPAAQVEPDMDASNFKVDHPEGFPVVVAEARMATPELNVTGVVSPDPSRQVPVPSLATGRIVEIDARVGDAVKKDQVLFKVRSTDIAGAYADYQKAVKNEKLALDNQRLAKLQQERAHTLFDHGAAPKSALETSDYAAAAAQTAVENSKVDTATAAERLKLLGSDVDHPSGVVEVTAPVSGVITDQQITESSGVQALTAPNPFTISDVSHVWIVCDVYENNLAQVRMGEYADVRLNAYPDRVVKARISNIGQIMDPNLHTAKVRLEVENPELMRFGMFVSATFHGEVAERRATVPSTAILHLHDRDWVYTPAPEGHFRRVEVMAGDMLSGGLQEIKSGIRPGDSVVANALVLQSTVEQ